MSGLDTWDSILATFSNVFTIPSFSIFIRMATAWALCPGRRTVTRVYQLAEPLMGRAHDAYHRFLREGAWTMTELWRHLLLVLVASHARNGSIPLDLDDTLFHKSGRKVDGASWWRDAVASTGQKVVHAFGLNLVVLTLRVDPPWGGEPLGLPVNMRLHRKGEAGLLVLAEQMLRQVTDWLPDRCIDLCADGFFAPLAGLRLPRVHITSRMRRDAALYDMPPKRRKGQRGRPRKKGRRLPTPEKMANARVGWREVTTEERGKTRTRLVLVKRVLWYRVLKDTPVLLVICRDPEGIERDDFFFTTNLDATAEQVVSRYSGRWSIEDTFMNTKQLLGGQNPQCWKDAGPERAAAFALWLYAIIWHWYLVAVGTRRSWIPLPWYTTKSTPSFADALAALRRALWRRRIFAGSAPRPLSPKMARVLIDVLAMAS